MNSPLPLWVEVALGTSQTRSSASRSVRLGHRSAQGTEVPRFAMLPRTVSPRSNTPPPGALHGTRRQEGGARREASERVVLRREGVEVMGWTLNLSRGGVRIIVEDPIELDGEYDILIGDEEGSGRKGRIVPAG